MINMSNDVINFYVKLIIALTIVFGIHILILSFLSLPLFENLIIESYTINYILALIIFTALYLLKKKYKNTLGFIFMAGSFLKFGVFFILFYPIYKQNGGITTLETTSFLIPYILCLFMETFFLAKLLVKSS